MNVISAPKIEVSVIFVSYNAIALLEPCLDRLAGAFLAHAACGPFPSVRMVDDMGWDHAIVRECDWVVGWELGFSHRCRERR